MIDLLIILVVGGVFLVTFMGARAALDWVAEIRRLAREEDERRARHFYERDD